MVNYYLNIAYMIISFMYKGSNLIPSDFMKTFQFLIEKRIYFFYPVSKVNAHNTPQGRILVVSIPGVYIYKMDGQLARFLPFQYISKVLTSVNTVAFICKLPEYDLFINIHLAKIDQLLTALKICNNKCVLKPLIIEENTSTIMPTELRLNKPSGWKLRTVSIPNANCPEPPDVFESLTKKIENKLEQMEELRLQGASIPNINYSVPSNIFSHAPGDTKTQYDKEQDEISLLQEQNAELLDTIRRQNQTIKEKEFEIINTFTNLKLEHAFEKAKIREQLKHESNIFELQNYQYNDYQAQIPSQSFMQDTKTNNIPKPTRICNTIMYKEFMMLNNMRKPSNISGTNLYKEAKKTNSIPKPTKISCTVMYKKARTTSDIPNFMNSFNR